MFGWERETETLAEIVQNPSDTPSRTHTQTRREKQEVTSLPATPPSSAWPACLLHQSWGQIPFNKREQQGEGGVFVGGRMTEMVSNYSYGMNRQAGSSSSFSPPPSTPSVPQMVNALIIRSCDKLGQWSCSSLLGLEIKLKHEHTTMSSHSAAMERLQ